MEQLGGAFSGIRRDQIRAEPRVRLGGLEAPRTGLEAPPALFKRGFEGEAQDIIFQAIKLQRAASKTP